MRRQKNSQKSGAIDLEFAVVTAINRYCEKHPTLTRDRQGDIEYLRGILSDTSLVAAQKHVAISKYVKCVKKGLLGRSDLRDYVLQGLALVPLESLMDELLRHHAAELHSRDMKIHALQSPKSGSAAQELLLESKTSDLSTLQETHKDIKGKAERVAVLHAELVDKYKALKQAHIRLCRRYGEHYSFSSEVLSQSSYRTNDVAAAEEGIPEEEDVPQMAMSVGSNNQRLFRLVPTTKGNRVVSQDFVSTL